MSKATKQTYSCELAVKTRKLSWSDADDNLAAVTVHSIFIEGDSPTAASVLAHLQRHRIERMEGVISVFQFKPRATVRPQR